ncbi:matrix-remodeling-associated protein 5-like, partial [Diretmus argenteus]
YQANEVHCTFRSLLAIPPGLPAHTLRINLGFNSISRIPDKSLAGLKRTELLMLHSNDLHHIPDGTFRDMKSLQILKLSYNKLKEISSPLTFSGLTSLLRLHLDHNLLQHLHPRALLQLPSLRLLRLQGNRLHQLHPHSLCTLSLLNTYYYSTLRHLDLANNSLTTLPGEILMTAPLLETLVLQANPWSCDCRMSWFLSWSLAHPALMMKCPQGPQCPVCASPVSLEGWGLLQQTDLSCASPIISSPGRDLAPEADLGEIQPVESFREPSGAASLGLSDQQGNSVDLHCNITHSANSQDIGPPPELSLAASSLSLTLTLTLDCPVESESYEGLWRILAYYSETAVQLEREMMLGKAPALAYRYSQAADTQGYYHTGVRASVKARPHWLMQPAISIQLNRAQSSSHRVQLLLTTRVSAHADPVPYTSSSSSPSPHPWVLISTNHTTTAMAAVAGSRIELPCPLLSSANPTVQWILPDGSKLVSPSSSREGRVRASASGLVLQKAKLSDAGLYHCMTRAGRDVDVLPLRLAVEESSVPPPGEQVGPSVSGLVGNAVSLPCKASGSPTPDINWVLPDGNIIRRGVAVSGGLTIQSNGSLSLPHPGLNDAGPYRCMAINQYGADSFSMQLELNSRAAPPLRTSFPTGPQSAAGRSTRIRAPLLRETVVEEGSGDEEEERISTADKKRPRLPQIPPNRRYPMGHPRRRGPVRGGPLRRGGEALSQGAQRRNRFDNRHRVSTTKQKIDPQKWADLLAKIRLRTSLNATNQPITAGEATAEPIGSEKNREAARESDKDGLRGEGKSDTRKDEGEVEGVEAEGSSIDDTSLQEEGLHPVHPETQTHRETTTDTQNETETQTDINTDNETEMQTDINTDNETETQTGREVTSKPIAGTNEIVSEPVGDNREANPTPSRTRSQGPRQGGFPNSVPNTRPQSPWNTRRRIGQRRRIINRPRGGRPLARPRPLPDPVNQRSHTMTPDATTTSAAPTTTAPGSVSAEREHSAALPSISSSDSLPPLPSATPTPSSSASPAQAHTDTTTASSPVPGSYRERPNPGQIEPRGRPHPEVPNQSRPLPDWRNPGANSIPDSHGNRPRPPSSPALPASPGAPVLRSRPRIADPHIRTVSAPAESTARLACEAQGEPKPSITWTKVSTGALMSVHSRAQRFEVLPNGTFVIQNVQLQDRGTYICSAQNSLGRDRMLTTLEVWSRPPRMQLANYREVTIHQGGELRLDCQADSVPAPVLSWVLPDRSVLTSADPSRSRVTMLKNGTLRISATLQSDRGVYRCVASNSAGAASASVRVHVSSLPPVIHQPREERLVLTLGMPVYAHCSARGAPPPTLRWRIPDGTLVRPSQFLHGNLFVLPNGTLHIRRLGPQDSGSYECTASNAVGAEKRTVRVVVMGAEGQEREGGRAGGRAGGVGRGGTGGVNQAPPPSSSRHEYRTLPLPVSPSNPFSSTRLFPPSPADRFRPSPLSPGSPRSSLFPHLPSFTNSPLKINKPVNASPTQSPKLSSLFPSSSLTPSLLANNTKASPPRVTTSSPNDKSRVSPISPPLPVSPLSKARIISTSPSIATVHYGGLLQLHCSISGNPPPTVIWRTPNRKLVDRHFSFDRRMKVHPNSTLSVQAVTEKDAGEYLCIARNKVADDYRLLRVYVVTKPAKIEHKQLSNQMVSFGGSLKVDCLASGLPDPAVRWSLPDGTMVNSVLQGEDRGGRARRLTVFDNGTLLVPAVGMGEEGEYTCYAENQGGQDTMKVKVKVMMTSPPTFTADLSYDVIKVRQGATAAIRCRATGDPAPTVTWFSPNRRVIPRSSGSGYYSERVVVASDGSLEVRLAQRTDAGNYTCRVSNSAGERSRVVGLEVDVPNYGLTSRTGTSNSTNTAVSVVTSVKQRVVKGQTILLPCPSHGSPPPRLAWLLPGNGVLPAPYYGSRLTVHRNGSLELRGVRMSDNGILVCVVRGERGETRIQVELVVSETQESKAPHRGPAVDGPPQRAPVLPGAPRSGASPDSVRSLSPPEVLPVTEKPPQRGPFLPTAPRPVGPPLHSGRPVSGPVVSTKTAALVSIINGENLRLPCPAGDTQGSLSWTLPSGKVLSRGESDDSGRYSVLGDGTLTVQQASVFDRGAYSCRSTNGDSSSVSVVTVPVIVIAYPPRITTGPAPVTYTRPGVAVELPCLTIATPRATVTWLTPDLSQLRVTGQARIYGNRYLSAQGSLVIQSPTSRDTGFYRCTAQNVIGTDTKATYLHVI